MAQYSIQRNAIKRWDWLRCLCCVDGIRRDVVDGKHVGGTDDEFEFQIGRGLRCTVLRFDAEYLLQAKSLKDGISVLFPWSLERLLDSSSSPSTLMDHKDVPQKYKLRGIDLIEDTSSFFG